MTTTRHPKITGPPRSTAILNRRQAADRVPAVSPDANQKSFVPTALAAEYVEKITKEFIDTKKDHAKAGKEVVKLHKTAEQYYVDLIKMTKVKRT